MKEAEFRKKLIGTGYSAPEMAELGRGFCNEMHTHDFSAFALVVEGEFILLTQEGSIMHRPGDTCVLRAGIVHAEKAGPEGAKMLVGKK